MLFNGDEITISQLQGLKLSEMKRKSQDKQLCTLLGQWFCGGANEGERKVTRQENRTKSHKRRGLILGSSRSL